MPKIFISYRRQDSQDITDRIFDRLDAHFGKGNVFMDIDTIPFGVDFRKYIADAVGQCDLLLAVIGRTWLDTCHQEGPKQGQRRLDDPTDFVRIEVQTGLERDIPVIPILVSGASVPAEDQMPNALKPLAYRNGVEVRSGRDFQGHIVRLIQGIGNLPTRQTTPPSSKTVDPPAPMPSSSPSRKTVKVVIEDRSLTLSIAVATFQNLGLNDKELIWAVQALAQGPVSENTIWNAIYNQRMPKYAYEPEALTPSQKELVLRQVGHRTIT